MKKSLFVLVRQHSQKLIVFVYFVHQNAQNVSPRVFSDTISELLQPVHLLSRPFLFITVTGILQ